SSELSRSMPSFRSGARAARAGHGYAARFLPHRRDRRLSQSVLRDHEGWEADECLKLGIEREQHDVDARVGDGPLEADGFNEHLPQGQTEFSQSPRAFR